MQSSLSDNKIVIMEMCTLIIIETFWSHLKEVIVQINSFYLHEQAHIKFKIIFL